MKKGVTIRHAFCLFNCLTNTPLTGKAFIRFIGQNLVSTILNKRRKTTMELISFLRKQVTFWQIERAVRRKPCRQDLTIDETR